MQAIELAPATKAVGALEKFVTEASAHFGGIGNDVAGIAEVEALGVVTADNHGEGVLEAEGLGDFGIETLGVALPDTIVNFVGICAGRFVEDGSQRGAGVFHVEVQVAGEERLLAEERAA